MSEEGSKPVKLVVTEVPRASLLEDGSHFELGFRGADGTRVTVGISPNILDSFLNLAHGLAHEGRVRRAASGGHLAVQPELVVDATAQAAVGGKAVVLGIRTTNGQVFQYSIPLGETVTLHNEFVAAIASAKKQARQTRQ